MGRDYHSVPQPIFSLELEAAGKRIRLLMRFGGVHRININKALKETLNNCPADPAQTPTSFGLLTN